jgi:ubiquinone/menaquinone biosynthesis C-methylase UbiE
MPDVYARITEVDPQIQERLIDVLEMRVSDVKQRKMWEAYLSDIEFPPAAQVLEIGCGTGAVSRLLAQWPGVARVLGVDPSPAFIAKARSLAQGLSNLSFEESDGRSLNLNDESFDVVVVHQVLSHVPQPDQLIAEAFRVLRPIGWLAIFDGDYATATVAIAERDPLESCVHAFRMNFVHDPWIVRRLPQLLQTGGFDIQQMRSHGYIEALEAGYMLTWVDRGAEVLLQAGHVGPETAEALKAEARRRNISKTWFGHIAFASILGQKPAVANNQPPAS